MVPEQGNNKTLDTRLQEAQIETKVAIAAMENLFHQIQRMLAISLGPPSE